VPAYVSAVNVPQVNEASLRRLRDGLAELTELGRELRTFAVTASRSWFDWQTMWSALSVVPRGAVMFNGMADGGDCLCRVFWWAQGGEVRPFHAKWNLGNFAGITRNTIMVEHMPQLMLSFLRHDLPSRGTRDAIRQAQERGIPVFEFHQFVAEPQRSAHTDPRDHDRRRSRGEHVPPFHGG
jgi:hypothetical protein